MPKEGFLFNDIRTSNNWKCDSLFMKDIIITENVITRQ